MLRRSNDWECMSVCTSVGSQVFKKIKQDLGDIVTFVEEGELEEVCVSAAEENNSRNGRLRNFYIRCFKSDSDAGLLME